MPLLTRNERMSLVEEICTRFHDDGIARLPVVGHFEKYTPLVHFRIAEPIDSTDNEIENFIYITDLFGNVDDNPGLFQGGRRMQYQGNFDGLSAMILQGVTVGMTRPAFRIHAIDSELNDKEKKHFDDSLVYINDTLRTMIPETRYLGVGHEFFADTYHIL